MEKLNNLDVDFNHHNKIMVEYIADDLKEKYKQKNEKTLLICNVSRDIYELPDVYFVLLDHCPKYLDLYESYELTMISDPNNTIISNVDIKETNENFNEYRYEFGRYDLKPILRGKIILNPDIKETHEDFSEYHNDALNILKLFDEEKSKINTKKISTKGENYIKNVYYININEEAIKWYKANIKKDDE